MKKLLFVMVAFAAISFTSCGSKTENDSVNDSTITDSDSVSAVSDSIVTDSPAAFVADSITAVSKNLQML